MIFLLILGDFRQNLAIVAAPDSKAAKSQLPPHFQRFGSWSAWLDSNTPWLRPWDTFALDLNIDSPQLKPLDLRSPPLVGALLAQSHKAKSHSSKKKS